MSSYIPTYGQPRSDAYEHYVPYERMGVSNSVFLPGSEIDPATGYLKPDRLRRCRVQGKQLEIETLNKKEKKAMDTLSQYDDTKGRIKLTTYLIVMGVVFAFLGMLTVGWYGYLEELNESYQHTCQAMQYCQADNELLRQDIAKATDEATIMTRALEIGMIHSNDAHTVRLEAPSAYPAQITVAAEVPQMTEVSAVAEQPTQIPMIANLGQ
ncbi:MAG: hypothetical protein E7319_06330 [Clostridiales bacterium]|nr:hypothetical protein [Clostridiales bacterium]